MRKIKKSNSAIKMDFHKDILNFASDEFESSGLVQAIGKYPRRKRSLIKRRNPSFSVTALFPGICPDE
jgi:hypothetical protein